MEGETAAKDSERCVHLYFFTVKQRESAALLIDCNSSAFGWDYLKFFFDCFLLG